MGVDKSRKQVDRITQTSRKKLRELQQAASDLLEGLPGRSRLTAVQGHEYVLGFMASWCRYVQYGVDAIRLLHDRNLGLYAAPIRRNLLEHAVSAHGLAQNPGVFDAYLRQHKWSAKKIVDARNLASVTSDPDLIKTLDLEIDEANKHLDVKAQAKVKFADLGEDGQRLYVLWLEESLLSHPTFATSALFLRETVGSEFPTLTIDPVIPADDWMADATCVDAMLLALDSLNSVMAGNPIGSDISRLNYRKNEIIVEYAEALRSIRSASHIEE